ncbi:MAG: S8 family serine peptidase, partial [Pseudomonadota bacterium]
MAAVIVIPKAEFQANYLGLGDQSNDEVSRRAGTMGTALLSGTSFSAQQYRLSGGLFEAGNFTPFDSADEATQQSEDVPSKSPRILEALGVVLLDDPSAEDLAMLANRATVIENFEVSLIEPVEEEAPREEDTSWHLTTLFGDISNRKLTGKNVRIGILDTGIDPNHPEFAGKHISFMEFDTDGFPISTAARDAGRHGTHVSGIAAGGTVGVAPDADLAVAAVLTIETEFGLSGTAAQILAGYNWLAHTNHAPNPSGISLCHVINASLGAPGYQNFLYSSVSTLLSLSRSLLIAAIGNSGNGG